jgi:hypothetical protein
MTKIFGIPGSGKGWPRPYLDGLLLFPEQYRGSPEDKGLDLLTCLSC